MFNYTPGAISIASAKDNSLLKRVETVPSGQLPPSEVCALGVGTVLDLSKPATVAGDYWVIGLAAAQRCPV